MTTMLLPSGTTAIFGTVGSAGEMRVVPIVRSGPATPAAENILPFSTAVPDAPATNQSAM